MENEFVSYDDKDILYTYLKYTEEQIIKILKEQNGLFGEIITKVFKSDIPNYEVGDLISIGQIDNIPVKAEIIQIKKYPRAGEYLFVFQILGTLMYKPNC